MPPPEQAGSHYFEIDKRHAWEVLTIWVSPLLRKQNNNHNVSVVETYKDKD